VKPRQSRIGSPIQIGIQADASWRDADGKIQRIVPPSYAAASSRVLSWQTESCVMLQLASLHPQRNSHRLDSSRNIAAIVHP
jgi:hypothetical protein